jgi:RecA/RadA recombinase
MSDFFRGIVESMKDSDTNMMEDGKNSAEFSGWVDTGCLIFNAVVSGSLEGGFADNKVLAIAGESSTGKTFLALGIVKQFLDRNPEAGVIYFDTESAVTKDMMAKRGIDIKRVIVSEPATLQDFRTKAIKFLDKYAETPKKKRPPLLVVLDSLGMLSSAKEIEDTTAGKDTRDMTKAQLIRGLFRVLRLKMAKLHVPMIITAHTYAVVGAYVPMQEVSGGGGLKYAADNIITLSKKKDKDDKTKEVTGVLLKARMYKSRLSRENQDVEMLLSYSKGLDRYYGLWQLALEEGLFKKTKVGSSGAIAFPDGEVVLEWKVEANPEKYIPEWLPQIEKLVNAKFRYGEGEDMPADEIAELEGEEGMLQSIFGEQTED